MTKAQTLTARLRMRILQRLFFEQKQGKERRRQRGGNGEEDGAESRNRRAGTLSQSFLGGAGADRSIRQHNGAKDRDS